MNMFVFNEPFALFVLAKKNGADREVRAVIDFNRLLLLFAGLLGGHGGNGLQDAAGDLVGIAL